MSSFKLDCCLIIWLVVQNYFAVAKGQCYYPGSKWADDQFPCDKYAYTTLCCPTGWTCFSNKLCIATDPSVVSSDLPLGTAIRGTCTNPRWNNTTCGDFCLDDPVSANNGSVISCGDNTWCCQPAVADGRCNCSSGKGTFQLSDGTAQTIIGVVGLQHTSTGPATLSTPSTLSTISKISRTTTSSAVSSSSLSSAVISTSTMALASTTNTGSASATTETNLAVSSTPVTQTTAFKVGISIAAVVAFAIFVGLIIRFPVRRWWRRRRNGGRPQFGGNYNGSHRVTSPPASEAAFQATPPVHPYDDPQLSTSQSRAALAEQISHNRRTARPFDIPVEDNPYSDEYMAGGAGR